MSVFALPGVHAGAALRPAFTAARHSSQSLQQTTPVHFGKEDAFKRSDTGLQMTIRPNVSADFIIDVEKSLRQIPAPILKRLSERGVHVVLAPDLHQSASTAEQTLQIKETIRRHLQAKPDSSAIIGLYSSLTNQLILPERTSAFLPYTDPRTGKTKYREELRPVTREQIEDVAVHESMHAVDFKLGDTPLKTMLRNTRVLRQLGIGAALSLPALLASLATGSRQEKPGENTMQGALLALGAWQFAQAGVSLKNFRSFSCNPAFVQALEQDLKNLPPDTTMFELETRCMLSEIKKPVEAFAYIATALLQDTESNRNMMEYFPETTRYVRHNILSKLKQG